MTPEEHRARKKLRSANEKQAERTSQARSDAARRRWHPELFVNEGHGDSDGGEGRDNGGGDGNGIETAHVDIVVSEQVIEEENEGGVDGGGGGDGGGGDIQVEVDQAGPSAMGESPDAQSATLGSSISSKTRAKRNFDSHLEGYDILQKMDILRHLCVKLQTSGKAVLGVEVTSRFQTKLTVAGDLRCQTSA